MMTGIAVLEDGRRLPFTADHRDLRRYELLAHRERWPALSAAPLHGTAVVAWCALTRTGQLDGMPVAAWLAAVTDLDGLGDEPADPTNLTTGGSTSS